MLEKQKVGDALPLTSLNHISILCKSVESSFHFFQIVLGFVPIRRPSSFKKCETPTLGAPHQRPHTEWKEVNQEGPAPSVSTAPGCSNYGVGIHLIQSENPSDLPAAKGEINPKDSHISFQCESMALVEKRLKEMGISYVQRRVEEGGVHVDQLFFHDPDGFMFEVCNCERLPVIPLAAGEPATECQRTDDALTSHMSLRPCVKCFSQAKITIV